MSKRAAATQIGTHVPGPFVRMRSGLKREAHIFDVNLSFFIQGTRTTDIPQQGRSGSLLFFGLAHVMKTLDDKKQ